MPLKTGSMSFQREAPKDDHVMIDLIRGSLKPPSQKAVNPPVSRNMTRTTIVSDSPPAIEYQVPRPSPLMHGFPSKSSHPRVSFAPSASFRPYRVLHTSLDTDSSPTRQKHDSGSFYGDKFRHSKHQEKKGWDDEQDYGRQVPRKHAQDPMAQIVDTISKITQNTSRRFDKVSKDLRAGQMSILHQTAEELQEMYNESLHHFYDDFISLESAYAAHHRDINAGLENASKVDQELSDLLAGTIQEHNRKSLSRKFPNTLFTSPLPTIISTPKLVL
ncbi:hypothetical protein D9615_001833 [Tricholomella constricta]|uniref:Uncharacterized protein n=1 Tax=Tricholomella constricta TaxID=117010 RepID=A0A8H5HNJ4_9AGAR|nr:hypothetical protein D9615_001833 [Tricholomella constricta]